MEQFHLILVNNNLSVSYVNVVHYVPKLLESREKKELALVEAMLHLRLFAL